MPYGGKCRHSQAGAVRVQYVLRVAWRAPMGAFATSARLGRSTPRKTPTLVDSWCTCVVGTHPGVHECVRASHAERARDSGVGWVLCTPIRTSPAPPLLRLRLIDCDLCLVRRLNRRLKEPRCPSLVEFGLDRPTMSPDSEGPLFSQGWATNCVTLRYKRTMTRPVQQWLPPRFGGSLNLRDGGGSRELNTMYRRVGINGTGMMDRL